MKRIRLLAIASTLMVALTTVAQEAPKPADPVEAHLKVLTEKLGLTAAQQSKARPILQEMTVAEQKIKQGDNLSHQERWEKMKPLIEKADKKLRKILSDDQKVKLDQLEHQAHPELHDKLSGAAQN